MLLPGAEYILAFGLVVVYVAVCCLVGFLVAAPLTKGLDIMIRSSKAYERYISGFKNSARWYYSLRYLFLTTALICTIVAGYTFLGPLCHIAKKLFN